MEKYLVLMDALQEKYLFPELFTFKCDNQSFSAAYYQEAEIARVQIIDAFEKANVHNELIQSFLYRNAHVCFFHSFYNKKYPLAWYPKDY